MNFLTIKKFFSINRKKKTVNIGDELKRSLIKNLEIFRHVPNETVSHIDDVKSTLTAILLLSMHDRSSLDYKLFDQKLKSLVEYFEQDVLLREYVNRVYSKQVSLFKYYNHNTINIKYYLDIIVNYTSIYYILILLILVTT